ncbi:MAG TPA: hypothetical protein VFG86_03700 [Chloroflexota bacterium]|nr:hypothetical protein [Chloroflexota bacterium]
MTPRPLVEAAVPVSSRVMNRADRITNLALFVFAAAAWAGIAFLFVNHYPTESAAVLLAGSLLIGTAVALTVAPLLWLAAFVRSNRIAYRGSWWRAGRRAALAGLVCALFVLMRGQGAFSLALAVFVVAMAILVELTLTLRG